VFADTARLAALSCFARLRADRAEGRSTLLVALVDATGAGTIGEHGLGQARLFEEVEAEADGVGSDQPWRERIAVMIRRLGPRHVLAPLGLFGAPQAIDYFGTLRAALSVQSGRDLLFFEERPHCLVPEALPLRLAAKGIRLPPASALRALGPYSAFLMRMFTGIGVPPVFGGVSDRFRLSRAIRPEFREAADWDPHRALGPRVQPVAEPWDEDATEGLFGLAAELGQEEQLGSIRSFRRRMARHALGTGGKGSIERSWLSLPDLHDADPIEGAY